MKYEDVERGMSVRVTPAPNANALLRAQCAEAGGFATVYDLLPQSASPRCVRIWFPVRHHRSVGGDVWQVDPKRLEPA